MLDSITHHVVVTMVFYCCFLFSGVASERRDLFNGLAFVLIISWNAVNLPSPRRSILLQSDVVTLA